MLKILQARLQQYMSQELPDSQAGFRKGREPEIKLPTSIGSLKKQEFQKNTYHCFIDYIKTFDCGPQQTGKFLKRREYRSTLRASWENYAGQETTELDMGQQTGSKSGKEYIKAVNCHLLI